MYCQEGCAAWLEGAPERVGELHREETQDPLSRHQSLRLESEMSPGLVTEWDTEQSYRRFTFISFLNSQESYWEPSCKSGEGELTQTTKSIDSW